MPSSKFQNIKYPIFGLKENIDFIYTLDKIYAIKNIQKFIVDDRSINNNSYLSRLIYLDSDPIYQRLRFDYTIRNTEELLKSDCKVGIDNNGIIHNFTIKEKIQYSERKIVKTHNKYFWFYNISYPFKIDVSNISEIAKDKDYYYGQLVYINQTWYFLGFSFEQDDKNYIWV